MRDTKLPTATESSRSLLAWAARELNWAAGASLPTGGVAGETRKHAEAASLAAGGPSAGLADALGEARQALQDVARSASSADGATRHRIRNHLQAMEGIPVLVSLLAGQLSSGA